MPLLTLEEALRFATALQLLLLAVLVLRDHRRARFGPAMALFAVCVACYLVVPLLLGHAAPEFLIQAAVIGAVAVPFAFWIAARLHFDDGLEPRAAHAAMFVALVALRYLLVVASRSERPLAEHGSTLWNLGSAGVALLAVGDALRRIHRGARTDLLLTRLRLRHVVLVGSGIYACSSSWWRPWSVRAQPPTSR